MKLALGLLLFVSLTLNSCLCSDKPEIGPVQNGASTTLVR